MNGSPQGWVILALLLTSLLVRVVPAFVKLRLSARARTLLERVLPMAVFLNFAVYIAVVELRQAPWPAASAFALCALLTFMTRAGLIVNTLAGTALWFAVPGFFPG
ncbi:hypothetical protein [Hydrogenophaga sp. RWCD_12]|uniref:hypothetical protein n=1 Tax=Hydrogenophaga sp. RWCD_12 TaxID=3391190 RepID=UPI0039847399